MVTCSYSNLLPQQFIEQRAVPISMAMAEDPRSATQVATNSTAKFITCCTCLIFGIDRTYLDMDARGAIYSRTADLRYFTSMDAIEQVDVLSTTMMEIQFPTDLADEDRLKLEGFGASYVPEPDSVEIWLTTSIRHYPLKSMIICKVKDLDTLLTFSLYELAYGKAFQDVLNEELEAMKGGLFQKVVEAGEQKLYGICKGVELSNIIEKSTYFSVIWHIDEE